MNLFTPDCRRVLMLHLFDSKHSDSYTEWYNSMIIRRLDLFYAVTVLVGQS